MSKKLKRLREKNDERTKLELKMARTTPMPYELEALGQFIVKEIKQLPPEAQPFAIIGAELSIEVVKEAADAFVNALPGIPASLSPEAIKTEAGSLELLYRHAPANSPLSIFNEGVSFIREVDEMVDPLGDDPPTIPHQLLPPFINRQAQFLINYILKNME